MEEILPIPEWLPTCYWQAWRALDPFPRIEEDAAAPTALSDRDVLDAMMVNNLCLQGASQAELRDWPDEVERKRRKYSSAEYSRLRMLKIARELGEFTAAELIAASGKSKVAVHRFVHRECEAVGKTYRKSSRLETVYRLREKNYGGDVDHRTRSEQWEAL